MSTTFKWTEKKDRQISMDENDYASIAEIICYDLENGCIEEDLYTDEDRYYVIKDYIVTYRDYHGGSYYVPEVILNRMVDDFLLFLATHNTEVLTKIIVGIINGRREREEYYVDGDSECD